MKLLVVTTSNDRFEGANPHPTGVWLEEFTIPYMEFSQNGVELIVASPKGGAMPIDPRSAATPEQAIEWSEAVEAAKNTVKLAEVNAADFDGIFLPGGHGPMFDLPEDENLQRLLGDFYESGKIISAVCHGPAGLVGARLADGTPLVKGKTLTCYTYSEEVAAKLDKEVPFILENRLKELGAKFIARENKADHIERDGQFITGQNPNSSRSIAQAIVAALNKQLQPRFAGTPREIVPAEIIAEFPPTTFLENIAVDENDNLFVTSYDEGIIYRLNAADKTRTEFAKIGGNAAGIAFEKNGDLLVAGSSGKIQTLYRINQNGETSPLITLADAVFLNGMTHLAGNRYLIADSYKSAIWEVDCETKTARVWLQSERLAHAKDPFHPIPMFPGTNGLKIYDNALYISSTQQQFLLRVPLNEDFSPGELEVFLTNINLDDFAFDEAGNLYGTTHIYNSVVRIGQDRVVTVIAEAEQGLTGSTAAAFGRTDKNKSAIFVTTNGGVSFLPPEQAQTGKIVRLEVGTQGNAPKI